MVRTGRICGEIVGGGTVWNLIISYSDLMFSIKLITIQMNKSYSLIAVALLIFSTFSAITDTKLPAGAQATTQTTNTNTDIKLPASAQAYPRLTNPNEPRIKSLQGSYLLGVPSIPMTIRSNSLSLTICNSHTFRIVRASAGNIIAIENPISTKLPCGNSNDDAYINLITSINSYQVSGSTLYLLSNQVVIARATKNQGFWPDTDKLEGKWNLHVLKIPLTVSPTNFSFKGCNSQIIDYAATDDGKIAFKPAISTKIGCPLDIDQIYDSAILKSNLFISRPLDFTLYESSGDETAYATPAAQ